MTRNLLSAFVISFAVTFASLIMYLFAPLIAAVFTRQNSGIGARSINLGYFLIIEAVTFTCIFIILNRRRN